MSEEKGTVKWGVMGTAGIASWGTIPGMQKAKGCGLYAIAGRSLEKAQAYKESFGFEKAYKGYDALLSDPEVEAVYIPLPNDIHCEWVIKALNAHKHVLCEKPLAMNEGELRRMFAAARDNGVILMEAYAYLHSPYICRLKEIISSGEIGKVDYIDTAFLTQDYSEDIRLHKEQGGGGIYDVGCYCTSMILSLIDSPVKYIKADAEFGGTGVDHMASVLIGFAIEKVLGAKICKNLFLCNRQKTNFYMLLMPGNKPFKTKFLTSQLNCARLSFAEADKMQEYLHTIPGSVSALELIFDTDNNIQLVIDNDLMKDEYICGHPGINRKSLPREAFS